MVAIVVLLQHGSKATVGVDPRLTDKGREQAMVAAAVLAAAQPRALVSSPSARAQQSIHPLALATGLPIVIDHRVRERMEYSPDVWSSVASFLEDWEQTTGDRDYQPASGDSSHSAAARLIRAVLGHAADDRLVVIATQPGVTTDLLRSVGGARAIDPALLRQGMPNGHLTTLLVTGDAIDVADIGVDPRVWAGHCCQRQHPLT